MNMRPPLTGTAPLPASPADTNGDTQPAPPAEEGLTWLGELHRELGRIAGVPLPEPTLAGLMRRGMTDWTYGTENTRFGTIRFLHRSIMDRSMLIDLPEDEDGDRRVVRDRRGIKIRAREITGGDLRCAVGIEMQLEQLEEAEAEAAHILQAPPKKPKKKERTPEMKRFRATTGTFVNESDPFTDTEECALSYITRCDNNDKLAAVLGTSASTISRILKPARERLGIESNIDLMLFAMTKGIGALDHVPSGLTQHLSEKDRELLGEFYSPDPDVRARRRARGVTDGSRWSRMYDKLEGLHQDETGEDIKVNRHWLVLYSVQDGVIELPGIEALRNQAAQEQQMSPEAIRFREAPARYLRSSDAFMANEAVVINLLVRVGYAKTERLAETVGVAPSTMSRFLQPMHERFDTESIIDLMLVAIARGAASVDHVPEGVMALLKPKELELVRDFYHPDPDIRTETRAKKTKHQHVWPRIYDKLEAHQRLRVSHGAKSYRHQTVLYAVRDGVIELPPAEP